MDDEKYLGFDGLVHFWNRLKEKFSTVPTFVERTKIPNGTDLNTITTPGSYCSEGYLSSTNLTNCPTDKPFIMNVYYSNGSKWYIAQEIIDFNEGIRHFRMKGSSNWNPWYTNFSTSNKPKISDLSGYAIVERGGTGRQTLTSGSYLVGNGANAVTLKTKAQVLSDIGAVSTSTFNTLLARVEALESGGGSGGIWQFTFNHHNFSFENGMTWGEFVNSTYNETVWCPECGEESQAFYTDGADGSPIYYSESGTPEGGCGCTSPIRLPMTTDDTVYPMDYDLIMNALSSGGGGGNVTFTYSDENSDHEFTVPAGTTWGQFISEGDYPMTDCDYGGHETSMFMTYNDASGGDGDDRVCGYCDGVCASCQYVDMGEMKFVYYEDPDEGYVYVYADDTIVNGGYYHAGSEM